MCVPNVELMRLLPNSENVLRPNPKHSRPTFLGRRFEDNNIIILVYGLFTIWIWNVDLYNNIVFLWTHNIILYTYLMYNIVWNVREWRWKAHVASLLLRSFFEILRLFKTYFTTKQYLSSEFQNTWPSKIVPTYFYVSNIIAENQMGIWVIMTVFNTHWAFANNISYTFF